MSLPSVTGLDHYIVRVNDLDAAIHAYSNLGFGLAPRGRHHKGTSNQTIILDANYLELLYFPEELKSTSRFNSFADDYEGPVAVALQTGDSFAVHAELSTLGFEPATPVSGGRPVHLAHGTYDASWANTEFPIEVAPLPLFFTCGHQTRDLVYRPEWQNHPNGARRLEQLIVVHPEPSVLAAAYLRLFGDISVTSQGDQLELRRGTLRLLVLQPEAFARRFPGIKVPDEIAQGWFAGSVVGVRDLEQTRQLLERNGVAYATGERGELVPPLSATGGSLLAFVQES